MLSNRRPGRTEWTEVGVRTSKMSQATEPASDCRGLKDERCYSTVHCAVFHVTLYQSMSYETEKPGYYQHSMDLTTELIQMIYK